MNSHRDFCANQECKTCNPDSCPKCGAPCELTDSYGRPTKFQGCTDCYRLYSVESDLADALRQVEYNKSKYKKEN